MWSLLSIVKLSPIRFEYVTDGPSIIKNEEEDNFLDLIVDFPAVVNSCSQKCIGFDWLGIWVRYKR